MFTSGHFNQRHLTAYFFNGGAPILESNKRHFNAKHFGARTVNGLQHYSSLPSGPAEIPAIASSIAIEVIPNVVTATSPVVIIAYIYDQFNKPMQGVLVSFDSSSPAVLSVPTAQYTDSEGRAVTTAVSASAGTAQLYALAEGLQAYVVLTVNALSGGGGGSVPVSTLTHGATIQVGSPGGGSGGPIKGNFTGNTRRWPTR